MSPSFSFFPRQNPINIHVPCKAYQIFEDLRLCHWQIGSIQSFTSNLGQHNNFISIIIIQTKSVNQFTILFSLWAKLGPFFSLIHKVGKYAHKNKEYNIFFFTFPLPDLFSEHSLYVKWFSRVTEGLLPVIGHHASDSGTSSAADDPILYAMTLTSAAGCPGSARGTMANRNAYSCRAS